MRQRPGEICTKLRKSWITLTRQIRRFADSGWALGGPVEAICITGLMPGMTPMPILARLIQQLKRSFLITDDCEITVESRSDVLSEDYLLAMAEAGVNRLRLPVVGFGQSSVELTGGRDPADLFVCLEAAHDVGIENIVADLIYGLPGRSEASWQYELELAARTPITGVLLHPAATAAGAVASEGPDRLEAEYHELATAEHVLQRQPGWSELGVGHFGAMGYETDRSTTSSDRAIDWLAIGAGTVGRVGDLAYASPQHWQTWLDETVDGSPGNVHVRQLHPLHIAALDWYALTESLALNGPLHPELAEPMAELLELLDRLAMIDVSGSGVTLTATGRFWAGNITAAMWEVVARRCREVSCVRRCRRGNCPRRGG